MLSVLSYDGVDQFCRGCLLATLLSAASNTAEDASTIGPSSRACLCEHEPLVRVTTIPAWGESRDHSCQNGTRSCWRHGVSRAANFTLSIASALRPLSQRSTILSRVCLAMTSEEVR